MKIVQSVNTTISDEALNKKINSIVDNMLECNETSIPKSASQRVKWNPTTSKINSQTKKDSIRQNLLKYISTAEGRKLLASLEVSKIQFVDMPNLYGSGQKGTILGLWGNGRLFSDFDNFENLSVVHHELTHALQKQTNSCTKSGKLCELEAHLNETKFIYQAIQQGILKPENLNKDSQNILLNYQKYGCDDAQFTLNYLNPLLVWSSGYREQFLLLSNQNTQKQLSQYARQLGLSGEKADSFIQGLINNDLVKQVSYKVDDKGNETKIEKIGDFWGPTTMTQIGRREGTLITFQYQHVSDGSKNGSWQKTKERYEKGNHITETLFDLDGCETEIIEIKGNTQKHTVFGTKMGARIETIGFVDENGNQCQTIINNMDPNFKGEIVQNFVNEQLVKESKTSLDGTTETKELKDGKWVSTSQSLRQRLKEASNQPQTTPSKDLGR